MIIDIFVILTFHLIFNSIDNGGVRRTPCVIILAPYIPLDKLYIIDESIIQITITLFIIHFMKNVFYLIS